MEDEQRAVDYAMGLVARNWGFFGDFQPEHASPPDDEKSEKSRPRLKRRSPPRYAAPTVPRRCCPPTKARDVSAAKQLQSDCGCPRPC